MYIWQQGKFNMIYGLKIKYKRLHIIRYNCKAKSYARSRTGSYFSHKLEGVIVALNGIMEIAILALKSKDFLEKKKKRKKRRS